MNEQAQEFLKIMNMEYPITVRVAQAFPEDKLDFKPHATKSRTAKEIIRLFIGHQNIFTSVVGGKLDFSEEMSPDFATMKEGLEKLEIAHKAAVEAVQGATDAELVQEMNFGPSKMRRIDILWLMLMDGVHHRGQFSIYLRLVDASVPSIYGPSADQPLDM